MFFEISKKRKIRILEHWWQLISYHSGPHRAFI